MIFMKFLLCVYRYIYYLYLKKINVLINNVIHYFLKICINLDVMNYAAIDLTRA